MRSFVAITFLVSAAAAQIDLGGMFANLGGGDADGGCTHKCEEAGHVPRARAGHAPSSNGCGSMGFRVATEFDFEPCCHVHDVCYDTCGTDKVECDNEFKKCMYDQCEIDASSRDACRSTANMFHMGTAGLGCNSFKVAQKNACECHKPGSEDL